MKTKLRPGWVLALLCTVLFFQRVLWGGLRKGTDTQNSASMAAMVFSTSSSPPSGPTIVETGFEP